jgi:hypothetical protein
MNVLVIVCALAMLYKVEKLCLFFGIEWKATIIIYFNSFLFFVCPVVHLDSRCN